jgi:DNA-binding protein HU-beta
MNKKDLINAFVEKLAANDIKVTKKDAAVYTDALFETVGQALVDGQKVNVAGFGAFEVVERAARTGRNPQTGETIAIPATKGIKFKASAPLKAAVKA